MESKDKGSSAPETLSDTTICAVKMFERLQPEVQQELLNQIKNLVKK